MFRPAYLLICLALTACQIPDKPARQWQMALQGSYDASISADGSYLLIASIFHGASLWDTRQYARLYNWNHKQGNFTEVLTTAISPDQQFALTIEERDMVIWSTKSGKAQGYWSAPDDVLDAEITNGGKFVFLGMANFRASLFDAVHGGTIREFRHDGPIRSVSLSADGLTALTGSEDHTARVWDINTGQQRALWPHNNTVRLVKLAPGGEFAFTASNREKANVWDVHTGKLIQQLSTGNQTLNAARFVSEDKEIITGNNNRLVQLWDIKSGKQIKSWKLPQTGKKQYSSSFIYDLAPAGENFLATSSDGYLFLLLR
ncbi:WD40 repeat domain-containing protein [Gynuella sunshinyii]|uniref:WD40 repeat domain-containing protein n=1 Tax=Gynuella sunshinyii TaxID=1445505 RepID=UPI00069BBE79|nr:hypothetical protein [Gynuella sunshinyii]